jgi:hypothetical protein
LRGGAVIFQLDTRIIRTGSHEMKSIRAQSGLSMVGWLFVLVLVAFFSSVAFKIFPHYLDNKAIKKIITQVETDRALEIRTIPELRSHISKGLQINAIDLKMDEAFAFKTEGNSIDVTVKYEKREPLIKNIDLVLNFDEEYRVRMP